MHQGAAPTFDVDFQNHGKQPHDDIGSKGTHEPFEPSH